MNDSIINDEYDRGHDDGYREGIEWARKHQYQTLKEALDDRTNFTLITKYGLTRIPRDPDTGVPFLIGDEVIKKSTNKPAGKIIGYEICGSIYPDHWMIIAEDSYDRYCFGFVEITHKKKDISDQISDWIKRANCDMGADLKELKQIVDDWKKQNENNNNSV